MHQTDWSKAWRFWKAGQEEHARLLDVPHDAMLEEKRNGSLKNGSAVGYFPGGKYYYAKVLYGEESLRGKTVQLCFDGVYGKTKVFLGGECITENHYGYSDFLVDLTEKLIIGQENKILVEVDNTQTPNSRWYTGSGIYRHVRLLTGGEEHIPYRGIHVRTVSLDPPTFHVDVLSQGDVRIEVLDGGSVLATAAGPSVDIPVPNGILWSVDVPHLYDIHVILPRDGEIVDEAWTRSGLRTIAWNLDQGLLINDVPTKLKGGCVHHDHGILGACSYYDAEHRRVRKLKDAGYNVIRTAHNPASEEFLTACDAVGMLVMHESFDQWREPKSEYDYSLYFEEEWEKDLRGMIEKSYNHPCVILYCIGNEVTIETETAREQNRRMQAFCHNLDNSRPVTNAITCMAALNKPVPREKEKPIKKASPDDVVDPNRDDRDQKMVGSFLINTMVTALPFLIDKCVTAKNAAENLGEVMDDLDITGMNYSNHIMDGLQKAKPNSLFLNTETFPCRIGKHWPMIEKQPHVIGDFMWTAWDYLGETGIGVPGYGKDKYRYSRKFPCINAGCGSFDLIGNPDSQGYLTAVTFGAYGKPYIGVRPMPQWNKKATYGIWRNTDAIDSWSWDGYEGKTAHITVFSIGAEVELQLNGKSIGKRFLQDYRADFKLPYEPGELKAISYDVRGERIAENALHSAGRDIQIRLQPEKQVFDTGDELAFVNITLADSEGIPVTLADCQIRISVEGEGTLLAFGSAASNMTESYLDNVHDTYYGKALAVIKTTGKPGEILITAEANGLAPQKYIIPLIKL